MSFSPEWLALREPIDHASVNARVRDRLRAHFAGHERVAVVDLGCGAGSNLRGTWDALPRRQHWTLVDYDERLLAAALARNAAQGLAGDVEIAYRQADLSEGAFDELIAGADLVTAAALFDLVSLPVIERLAEAVAAGGQAFYTVLTYDGIASFLPEHPADTAMREAFNLHQRRDKGFGRALGPGATAALAVAFASRGYQVMTGASPWVVDNGRAVLRGELDAGWAAAVRETGRMPVAEIDAWLAHRRASPNAVTIVGHQDLLALPPL